MDVCIGTLIERTGWIVGIAGEFRARAASHRNSALEPQAYLSSMEQLVAIARRVQVDGETVPAAERAFSLFEQHTELIKRGRR